MVCHGELLRKLTRDDTLVKQLREDPDHADLDPERRAMVDFALKLTRTPAKMQEEDVEALREHGYDDRNILDIVLIASLYAFYNRLADGVGLEVGSFFQKMYEQNQDKE